MAKNLSKIGIVTGQTIEASEISQSIDALTGVEAYNLNFSGSLNLTGSIVTGSISNSVTSSYAITASHALNVGSGGGGGVGTLQQVMTSGSSTTISITGSIISASGGFIGEYFAADTPGVGVSKIAMSVTNRIDLSPNNSVAVRLSDSLVSLNKDTSINGEITAVTNITASGNISASGDLRISNISSSIITSSTAQIGNLEIKTGLPGGSTMFSTTNNVGFTFNDDVVSQPEGKNLGNSTRSWNNLYQGANTSDYLVDVANGVKFDFVPSVVSYYLWNGTPTRDDATAENKPPIYSINPGQGEPTSYRGYFGIIQPSGSVDTLSTNTANKFGLFVVGQGGRTILGRKDYNRTNDSVPVDKMFTIYDGQTSTRELFSIETGSGATRISGSTTITGNLTASANIIVGSDNATELIISSSKVIISNLPNSDPGKLDQLYTIENGEGIRLIAVSDG